MHSRLPRPRADGLDHGGRVHAGPAAAADPVGGGREGGEELPEQVQEDVLEAEVLEEQGGGLLGEGGGPGVVGGWRAAGEGGPVG